MVAAANTGEMSVSLETKLLTLRGALIAIKRDITQTIGQIDAALKN